MKIRILKTNRRIKESPHMIATKEQDGKLGNIELTHYTNVEDILLYQKKFLVDPGSNLKRANDNWSGWFGIADELNKPGVFDKLARYFKRDV